MNRMEEYEALLQETEELPPALEDAVEVLGVAQIQGVATVLGQATLSPGFGARQGLYVVGVIVGQASEFVKGHVDVGANLALDAH